MNTIKLYIDGNLTHELVTTAKVHQISRLLIDEEGRYWIRMLFGSGFDYNLIEPVSITIKKGQHQ